MSGEKTKWFRSIDWSHYNATCRKAYQHVKRSYSCRLMCVGFNIGLPLLCLLAMQKILECVLTALCRYQPSNVSSYNLEMSAKLQTNT
jgi:hypothetical protein